MNTVAQEYNQNVKNMAPEEILRFFIHKFPGEVAFSTSLGAEDQVITRMLFRIGGPVKIFTLDTGRMFQESYDLFDTTEKKFNIRIEVCFPDQEQVKQMISEKGINLFYESVENRKLCCNIRKVLPLKKALEGMKIWITGLRQSQAVSRNDLELVSWDESNSIIKVNPLLNWSGNQVWNYIKEFHIPYNLLHDQGFSSIGCMPCTRAVLPGEDERAGRWWWESPENKECGLHVRKK